MKKYRATIIAGIITIILLVVSFMVGGSPSPAENPDSPAINNNTAFVQNDEKTEETEPEIQETKPSEKPSEKEPENKTAKAEEPKPVTTEKTDKYKTEPVPTGKPLPSEPQNTEITETELTCTLSVECNTLLKNLSRLNPEKIELVPENGVIYEKRKVVFYEGESVFNVLSREMKKNKIHLEFMNTPVYNSAYVEGIANLYELDCGELSGWLYKVNGWFPNYGSSRYMLKQGDDISWMYTCDQGADIGAHFENGGGQKDD